MSEPNAGAGDHPRDPHRAPDWGETPGASVFDRPASPPPPPPPRSPRLAPPPPATPSHPGGGAYPGPPGHEPTIRYDQPHGWPASTDRPAYGGDRYAGANPYGAPVPHTRTQPRPQPEAPGRRRPGGPGGAARGGAPGPDRRDRGRPPAPGGGGLPVGAGALIGALGVACVLLSLMVLPWFTAGGDDVTLADIRSGFAVRDDPPPDPVSELAEGVPSTLPDGAPAPGDVQDAVEEQVRDAAAGAVAAAVEEGKARYLELYAERLWVAVAAGAVLAVALSTLLSPRSAALSLILGFRWLSGLLTLAAAAAHGAALWVVFGSDVAPAIAVGAWLGLAGLGAVFVACIVGPKG
ncbi:MAG TPA: hypothetical protein VFP06_04350 [Acidimicrobiales bacterium]|nr:hypothetical protein [Acidimicrobiales bacterium]